MATDDEIIDLVIDAFNRANAAGDDAVALDILRSVHFDRPPLTVNKDDRGNISIGVNPMILAWKARQYSLSLQLGQWGDAPRHSPSSDSPHGFLTLYESLPSRRPEQHPLLRFYLDELRVQVAGDHAYWAEGAAWALDLLCFCEEMDGKGIVPDEDGRVTGMANLAVAMSNLGYKNTARNLYHRMLTNDTLRPESRARLLIRFGDFLWNAEDHKVAEKYYDTAIDVLNATAAPTVNDLHELVRALQRRADARLRRGNVSRLNDDLGLAIRTVERARAAGSYESVRSVDAAIQSDVRHLLHMFHRTKVASVASVVDTLVRIANGSAAAVLRQGIRHTSVQRTVVLSGDRADIRTRATFAQRWAAVADDDVKALLSADHAVLLVTATETLADRTSGISVLCGAGAEPQLHYWQVSGRAHDTLQELLSPPPGTAVEMETAWTLPWHAPELAEVAKGLFPVVELGARIAMAGDAGLRIVPFGDFWRFPFAAVPVNDNPLAVMTPYVLAPGLTANLPAPTATHWLGHFDISLNNALYELLGVLAAIRRSRVSFELFGEDELDKLHDASLRASHVLFSGHGIRGRGQQQLQLSTGHKCGAADFDLFANGASIVLNACWSASTSDVIGSDPADLALSLLATGAHSVLGTVGPISDREAARFLARCVPLLIAGNSIARAVHQATTETLVQDPDLPLSAWASYSTTGRAVAFAERRPRPTRAEEIK